MQTNKRVNSRAIAQKNENQPKSSIRLLGSQKNMAENKGMRLVEGRGLSHTKAHINAMYCDIGVCSRARKWWERMCERRARNDWTTPATYCVRWQLALGESKHHLKFCTHCMLCLLCNMYNVYWTLVCVCVHNINWMNYLWLVFVWNTGKMFVCRRQRRRRPRISFYISVSLSLSSFVPKLIFVVEKLNILHVHLYAPLYIHIAHNVLFEFDSQFVVVVGSFHRFIQYELHLFSFWIHTYDIVSTLKPNVRMQEEKKMKMGENIENFPIVGGVTLHMYCTRKLSVYPLRKTE